MDIIVQLFTNCFLISYYWSCKFRQKVAKEKDALNITLSNCINSTNVHLRNYCTKIFVIVVNNVSVGALLMIKQLLAVILTSRGGGGGLWRGYNFLRGLILGVNFENAQNVREVELLRHRTDLLCKSCQTILWLKQIHVSFKWEDKKICFGGSLSATKCYLWKAWPRNLSAISTTRNVTCTHIHLCIHLKSGKKYIDFF